MTPQVLTFTANKQVLAKTGGPDRVAAGTKGYVKARFELTGIWAGFETVLAIWATQKRKVPVQLDAEGVCDVPDEIVGEQGRVRVNLVHALKVKNRTVYRLTTFQVDAVTVEKTCVPCETPANDPEVEEQ